MISEPETLYGRLGRSPCVLEFPAQEIRGSLVEQIEIFGLSVQMKPNYDLSETMACLFPQKFGEQWNKWSLRIPGGRLSPQQ